MRYAHFHYPKKVAVCCPKCSEKAIAINPDAHPNEIHFIDISGYRKVWNLKCSNCFLRTDVEWGEFKPKNLWYKVEVRGLLVWAWNEGHLRMILKKLRKEDASNAPWHWFGTYIPKDWFTKLSGKRELLKIENLLP